MQRVDTEVLADVLDRARVGDQLLGIGKVDSAIARMADGRAGDAQVNLGRTGVAPTPTKSSTPEAVATVASSLEIAEKR